MRSVIPIGVAGGVWRADVTTWGAIRPRDGAPALDWFVAADDRWHVPEHETSVRQLRTGGTPVVETRVRIPQGDAVHRTWTVADGGGQTLVEVTNESPLPVAVAFSRADLRTARPPAPVPIVGIDLPAERTIVLPVAHRTSVTVGLAHDRPAAGPLDRELPPADAVVRGWRAACERASRLELPDVAMVERVVGARCDVTLLDLPDVDAEPAEFLLALGELVRMGAGGRATAEDVAAAVAAIARRPGWLVDVALDAAAIVLARWGESRAVRDVGAILARRTQAPSPTGVPPGIGAVAAIERRLARSGELLPGGIPGAWRGSDFACHGVPVGPCSTVSYAVRWHGENAAVLWEVAGDPVVLRAPAVDPRWSTAARSGDALWRPARPEEPSR
jgi:hypothetical protein